MDRLRKFVQAYPGLSLAERASLLTAVLQAFELRQLNSKLAVEYDPTVASILSVRGLRERIAASGLKTFRIDTPAAAAATRTTLKRKAVAVAASLNTAATETPKE